MKAKFLTVAIAMTALAIPASVMAAPSGPGPGNAPNAKSCQKGGWEQLVRSNGTTFSSEEACTSYASKGGTLLAKPTGPTLADCMAAYTAATNSPAPSTTEANYIVGTNGGDVFMATEGTDVICGFAGDDTVSQQTGLRTGDIFLGGSDDDDVFYLTGGTFNGDAGNDIALDISGGTFNGGTGNDFSAFMNGDGTFNGGDGDDNVQQLYSGTFNGEGGCDSVTDRFGGATVNLGNDSPCPAGSS